MNEKQSRMTQWLDSKISVHEQKRLSLLDDDRGDEAAFEKIYGNVYDIFRTILSVAEKSCAGEEEAMYPFFMKRLEQIPASWNTSFLQAQAHGDADKMHIEQIKLDAVAEVKAMFQSIWGVTE